MKHYVQNINGSAERWPKCSKCGAWIDHYANGVKSSLLDSLCCARCGRVSDKLDGAHVVLHSEPHGKVYIIPLCHECNTKDDNNPFEVDCELVPMRHLKPHEILAAAIKA